jgi:hypothetical protein
LDKLNKKVAYSAMIQSLNLNSKLSDEIITANVKLILNIYTKIVLNRNIIK